MSAVPDDAASIDAASEACAREPIRIPGCIQPHGVLLVLEPDSWKVLQASVNATSVFGLPADPVGRRLDELPDMNGLSCRLVDGFSQRQPQFTFGWLRAGTGWQLTAHHTGQGVLVEFERDERAADEDQVASLNSVLRQFVADIEHIEETQELYDSAARQVHKLTGFNRVMIYRFDADWHGTVVAQSSDGVLPSYLDLRFPASDIPPQARELYVLNRIRLIASSDYQPVEVQPAASPVDGQALDLSLSVLRSVSPVHLEYMRNMGTGASMSMSIIVEGRLWGLISCHHQQPRRVSARVRAACDFLSHIVSMQVGVRERSAYAASRTMLRRVETELVTYLTRAPSFQDGLAANGELWMRVTGATGAAVVLGSSIQRVGDTPSLEQIETLAHWLNSEAHPGALFQTDHLSKVHPAATDYADVASGLVAASISQVHAGYLLWFRPEVVRTVTWGGDPSKAVDPRNGRLAPRHSFEIWKELVRGRAGPWSQAELDAAADLRSSIIDFVLRRAEERAGLTEQLEKSNRELESFSYSISHDLRAPFRHIIGYARLLKDRERNLDDKSQHYLGSIVDSALAAGTLVDDLLHFSQLGRSSLSIGAVDMNKLVAESILALSHETQGRAIEWDIGALPPTRGDGSLLRQAVTNLVANAIKYSAARQPARIRIHGERRHHETVYAFEDNGVGFDMAYVGKLFGVFQRLHRAEEYEGTGIGLALTRRIIDRHGGWIQADGELDVGATFRIGLPATPPNDTDSNFDSQPKKLP
ncbi:ATP-binding protein [soil metagenome]